MKVTQTHSEYEGVTNNVTQRRTSSEKYGKCIVESLEA